jgi:hypothetical protein
VPPSHALAPPQPVFFHARIVASKGSLKK